MAPSWLLIISNKSYMLDSTEYLHTGSHSVATVVSPSQTSCSQAGLRLIKPHKVPIYTSQTLPTLSQLSWYLLWPHHSGQPSVVES